MCKLARGAASSGKTLQIERPFKRGKTMINDMKGTDVVWCASRLPLKSNCNNGRKLLNGGRAEARFGEYCLNQVEI